MVEARELAQGPGGGHVAVGVVGGVDDAEVRERLGEHPAGGIVRDAGAAGGRIGPGLQTAQVVAQAERHRPKQVNEPRARQQGE